MKIRDRLGILSLFLLLAPVAYSTIFNSFFLSDDFVLIGRILEGDHSVTWGLAQGGFFRPLLILCLFIDSALWGTVSAGYHLTNIALHGLNSYVVFVLTSRLTRNLGRESGLSLRVSVLAGLIFLLLPSHTEAVTWISGRADLLATFFALMALVSFVAYKREGRRRYPAYIVILFMFALLSKESAICLPLIVIAFEIYYAVQQGKTFDLRALKLSGLLVLTLLFYLLIRYALLGTLVGGYGPSHYFNFKISLLWERLPKFAVRCVLPPLPEQLSSILTKPFKSIWFIVFAFLCVVFTTTLLVYRHKLMSSAVRKAQNSFLILLLGSFLCSLLPVITMGISLFDTLGERFVYLPSVFSSIAVAYLSVALIPKVKRWMVLVLCLVIFYSASLYRSNKNWNEAATLSQSILQDLAGLSRHDEILILNVPGSLRGVPVYRNGLEEALTTFQHSKQLKGIQVVAYHDVPTLLSEIDVTKSSDDVLIRLLNEKMEFTQVNNTVECAAVVEQSRKLLRIKLQDCFVGKDLFFFQHGRMIEASNILSTPSVFSVPPP